MKKGAVKAGRRISIFGMGYVGLVTAATFLRKGHAVVLIDVLKDRVEMVNRGRCPIFEPGVEKVLAKGVRAGRLEATMDGTAAVRSTDFSFICVGTPSKADGSIDLQHVKAVSRQIGRGLRSKRGYHVVVMKSTVVPTTTSEVVRPIIEKASGRKAGRGFGLAVNPEFLKEGEALQDSTRPDRIVVGGLDEKSIETMLTILKGFDAPIIMTDLGTAEMIKYASNTFLAAKVALSNEIANICSAHGIDVYEVMKGVGLDKRIGPHFLRAGAGFGGSCFPKDLRALKRAAEKAKVKLSILPSILDQNELQPLETVKLLKGEHKGLRGKRIALLGLSFKPNTDDVRETRALPIALALLKAGAVLKVYDPNRAARDNFMGMLARTKAKGRCKVCASAHEALKGADGAVIQTEAREFKSLEPRDLKRLMRRPVIVDGRRALDPHLMHKHGIIYRAIGWRNR